MKEEIWRPVAGYEGIYEISSLGRVKRLARSLEDTLGRHVHLPEKILKPHTNKQTGYPCINLTKGKVTTWHCIHRIIADAFIPNPDNLPCVNHKDENRSNSVLENLERCTYGYNNMYGSAPIKRRQTLKNTLNRKGVVLKGIQYGKNLKITQYSLDGEKIAFFEGGALEIKEKLGFNCSSIGSCCRHKSRTAFGFVWRYEGDSFSYEKPRYNKGKDFSNCKPKTHQKYVIKVDKDGQEIERYKSVSVAAKENGFDRHRFSKTKPINGIVHINGMFFVVEKKENEYIPKGRKGPRPDLINKGAKPVSQYTKDNVFVKEHKGARDAARNLGLKTGSASDITNCCRGNLKTAYGYIWRYADKKEQDKKGIAPKQLTLF